MLHTLDFIYSLRQNASARESILCWLEVPGGDSVTVEAFRLEWITGTEDVRISLWDQSYLFRWKCPDYQCPAKELAELIRKIS